MASKKTEVTTEEVVEEQQNGTEIITDEELEEEKETAKANLVKPAIIVGGSLHRKESSSNKFKSDIAKMVNIGFKDSRIVIDAYDWDNKDVGIQDGDHIKTIKDIWDEKLSEVFADADYEISEDCINTHDGKNILDYIEYSIDAGGDKYFEKDENVRKVFEDAISRFNTTLKDAFDNEMRSAWWGNTEISSAYIKYSIHVKKSEFAKISKDDNEYKNIPLNLGKMYGFIYLNPANCCPVINYEYNTPNGVPSFVKFRSRKTKFGEDRSCMAFRMPNKDAFFNIDTFLVKYIVKQEACVIAFNKYESDNEHGYEFIVYTCTPKRIKKMYTYVSGTSFDEAFKTLGLIDPESDVSKSFLRELNRLDKSVDDVCVASESGNYLSSKYIFVNSKKDDEKFKIGDTMNDEIEVE